MQIKKYSAFILVSSLGFAAQAQPINAFNGENLGSYTTTLIDDNSSGAGDAIAFSDSTGKLVASYSGPDSLAVQSSFLTPIALPVGDELTINTSIPASGILEDLGLMISSTATPPAASSGNSYNSKSLFDWASISVRPSDASLRVNTSISGVLNTGNSAPTGILMGVPANTVAELFIQNNGGGSFSLGYVDTSSAVHVDETIAFAPTSSVGDAIGVYADLRNSGTSLGGLSNLAVVPEPSTLALGGLGLAGLLMRMRRTK